MALPVPDTTRSSRHAVLAGVVAGAAILVAIAIVLVVDMRAGLAPAGDRIDARAGALAGQLDAVGPARERAVLASSSGPARLVRDGEVIAQTGPPSIWSAGSAGVAAGLASAGAGWGVGDGFVETSRSVSDGSRVELRGRIAASATSITPAIWFAIGSAILLGALVGLAVRRQEGRRHRMVVGLVQAATGHQERLQAHDEAMQAGIEVLSAVLIPLPLPAAASTGTGRLVRNEALARLLQELSPADAAAVESATARSLSGLGPVSDRVGLSDDRVLAVESWAVPAGRVVALADHGEQERLADVRRRVSAGAARRLRAPLQELHSLASEMHSSAPAPQATLAARMLTAVDRLSSLTRSMVRGTEHDISRAPRAEKVGAAGLLWGLARGDEDRLRAAGLRMEIDVAPTTPAIWADLGRVQQVMAALIANAERHTPTGGTITLWAAPRGDDRVAIGVRDTGPGVAPSDLRVVFEPFVRGENAVGHPGDGLGLTGARALAEGLGGSLAIEPGRDGGARVELPAASSGPRADAIAA